MKVADTRLPSRRPRLKVRSAYLGLFWISLAILLVSGFDAQERARKFELEDASPDFWKLVSRDAKLETVASGFGFTEGPVWDPSGFVYVSDETLNKIFRVYPDGRKES